MPMALARCACIRHWPAASPCAAQLLGVKCNLELHTRRRGLTLFKGRMREGARRAEISNARLLCCARIAITEPGSIARGQRTTV